MGSANLDGAANGANPAHDGITVPQPRYLRVAGGASGDIAQVLAMFGLSKPLIVTDPFMAESRLLAAITDPLQAAGISAGIFADTVPDPTTAVVDQGLATLQAGDYDCMIGFGGGSPMDTAKAIGILDAGGGRMRDWKVPASANMRTRPLICVPTTAGTGTEVTRFVVITDTETDEKMLIQGLAAVPLAALVDYELTMGKPYRLTADTGIDAFTHGLEAFVSRLANVHSDGYALSALKLIFDNVRTVCADPGNTAARAAMALGATHGGFAFNTASVALVHGMSRPIGAHFHVPHGLSNAMLLPAITAFSLSGAPDRYAAIAQHLGLVDAQSSDQAAGEALAVALRSLNRDLTVPTPRAWGINEAKYRAMMPTMARQALASGSPDNNPRVPTVQDIITLYEEVYG
jgi:alcohol dehydrogenase class IV